MGRWADVRHVKDLMEARGIKKVPGCSLVDVGGVLHEFFVGDDSHPETKEIYKMLDEIMKRLKMEGYVGNTNEVNGLVAGALAGAAFAARTRSWTQVIGMAGLVSVFSAAADYSRTS
ncbi:pentatricopeptide repeat-containing protein [Quercus suber]|uniref:Pentatricopeptide repeat-containing protein n=1 Tax=Quercus suber TaxID=58331 RepID=A0AAW0LK14_QUESU